jgi:RimJ/RimL family protein N-acetyltransferase
MNAPRVRLRDATIDDADLLDAWSASPSPFNDFGTMGRGSVDREALMVGPMRNETRGVLIVEVIDGARPIGTVSWHRVGYGPPGESDAWNIGIELAPDGRGHGYGGEAQRLVARYLFENTAANRVEAQTDTDNSAEQRALEKAGFVREGVMRGAQFRAGAYHDLVTYSILRAEIEPD